MARSKKLELSWVQTLKQWRKRRKVGDKTKTWYLGTGDGKFDAASYERALQKWRGIAAELDAADVQSLQEKRLAQYRQSLVEFGAELNARPGVPKFPTSPTPAPPQPEQPHRSIQKYLDAKPIIQATSKLLGAFIDDYVSDQRTRYQHGLKFPDAPQSERIGAARFLGYKNCAAKMKQSFGQLPLPQDEQGWHQVIKAYRQHMKELMAEEKISGGTFNERIKTLRHWLGWMYDAYHIKALPRKIDELCSRYKVENTARSLKPEMVRKIFDAAGDKLKCWIALAVNCGFYAVDIANLRREHLKGDFIECDRHKTGVPTRFKLWKVTKEILKRTANGKEYVFEAADGGLIQRLDPDANEGKGKWMRLVDNQMIIVKRKLEIKGGVSFSNFRDTSSSKIESIDRTLTDIFDGHKDQRMARFYVDRKGVDMNEMFAPLDRATDELEKWYGLTVPPIKEAKAA